MVLNLKSETYISIFKPFVDLLITVTIVTLFFWLIILIVLAYILTFQFPIFFTQPRLGKEGKIFKIWKFRTLSVDVTKTLEQRRFVLGDILRITGCDELPQGYNIIKGEMSWIGPRPLPIAYDPLFSEAQRKRFVVKPGITGWAQVNGRHSISWKEKLRLDIEYVNNVSFFLDLKIVFKTVALLLSLKQDKSLEEEKFKGHN